MKISLRIFFLLIVISALTSCDNKRIYETNISLENKFWITDSLQNFEIDIDDKSIKYNIYMNIRNSSSYPYNNIYIKYHLKDTDNTTFEEQLINNQLFNSKTGKPLGQSGIGDLFDNQFLLLENYTFDHSGKYIIELQHYMRPDSLLGVLATGIRVEKAETTE